MYQYISEPSHKFVFIGTINSYLSSMLSQAIADGPTDHPARAEHSGYLTGKGGPEKSNKILFKQINFFYFFRIYLYPDPFLREASLEADLRSTGTSWA